jgi:hypothetical protein
MAEEQSKNSTLGLRSESNPKSKIQNLKFIVMVSAMLFALSVNVEAQQPAKVPRIGFLSAPSPSAVAARAEAFRQGLRDLGYVEGKDIAIEYRYAEGKTGSFPRTRG